jgi:hypothetical protein
MLPILLSLVSCAAIAAPQGEPGTSITIYSSAQPGAMSVNALQQAQNPYSYNPYNANIPGYALVRLERDVDLPKDRSNIQLTDVAAQIDATTVTFASLSDPAGTRVLEQSFQFDVVSMAKLLERYLDKKVGFERTVGQTSVSESGTLLSSTGGYIIRKDDGEVNVLANYNKLILPELPGGLITRPTLLWDVATDKPGKHRARITYQTAGITWWADYNLTFTEGKDANHGILDIGAWVSILNQSGGSYTDARLKLIAGDVHRAEPPGARDNAYEMAARKSAAGADTGFHEKSFFEYHLYTLGRRTSIPDRSTKQIELFAPALAVPCEKVLVYYGLAAGNRGWGAEPYFDRNYGIQTNKKVDVYLRFKNAKDAGLGIPLPSGRIRVSKMDPTDKSLEFIGEDVIDHTPKDETVLVRMGSAFDVVGERRQVDFKVDTSRKTMEEEIEIKIRNHKSEPVTVLVKENLYRWVEWTITKKTMDFEKLDSRTIQFPVTVDKDGEATVRYTVKYTW